MTGALVDQDARTRIRSSHDASLFVEAGAGTGKTRALVDRVVALVAAGQLELRDLAAITFTEAAAAELRDRIRSGLEAVADGRGDPAPTAVEQQRCRAALDQVDEAALTTLHGFAFRILSEHPLEAGLPPGFELLDDITAAIAFEQHWAAFVDGLFADPALEQVLLTRAAARAAASTCSHERRPRAPRQLRPHPARTGLRRSRSRSSTPRPSSPRSTKRSRCAATCCDDDDKLRSAPRRCRRPPRHAAATRDDRLDLLEWLDQRYPKQLAYPHGRSGNWNGEIDEVKARAPGRSGPVGPRSSTRSAGPCSERADRARRQSFVCRFADERRRTGRLEFHDLLVLARDVLRTDPSVRVRGRASATRPLLLDEFQDTDPLQIEIAVLLADARRPDAGDEGSGPTWRSRPARSSSSAIRSSRSTGSAAPTSRVYHDAQHEFGLEPQSLVQNFRSVPGVARVREPRVRRAARGRRAGVQAAARAPRGRARAARRRVAAISVVVFGDSDDDEPDRRDPRARGSRGRRARPPRSSAKAGPSLDPDDRRGRARRATTTSRC